MSSGWGCVRRCVGHLSHSGSPWRKLWRSIFRSRHVTRTLFVAGVAGTGTAIGESRAIGRTSLALVVLQSLGRFEDGLPFLCRPTPILNLVGVPLTEDGAANRPRGSVLLARCAPQHLLPVWISNTPTSRIRRHSLRVSARVSRHPTGRTAACRRRHQAVDGGLAWPVGETDTRR